MLELLESSQDRQEAFRTASPFFVRLFPNMAGGVMAISASKNQVDSVAWWGQERAPDFFTPHSCWALRRGTTHLCRKDDPEPFCPHVDESCACSLCVPMVAAGEALGVLHLQPHEGFELTQETLELAQRVAEQLSLAMANLSLRDTLRQQSIRDPLTGLFNRRFMEESLEREIFRARRKREPVSVIMLDVDHFKRFNDQYGHDAGDVVIQAVGRHLRDGVRAEDVVCRYGGEEFVLILPGSNTTNAAQRAESLRQGVSQLALTLGTTQLPHVTCSIGVASYPINGQTTGNLLKAADTALYQAKRNGRDRVIVAAMPELKVGAVGG
jgi:diguanylate cyclase (GGDEF)-like protein